MELFEKELTEMQKLAVGLDLLGIKIEVLEPTDGLPTRLWCEDEEGYLLFGVFDGQLLTIVGLDLDDDECVQNLTASECIETILDYLLKNK